MDIKENDFAFETEDDDFGRSLSDYSNPSIIPPEKEIMDLKEKYLKEFSKKHGLEFIEVLDGNVASFEGGRFYGIDDIFVDIDNNVTVGLITMYANQGTGNGSMTSYRQWLADNFNS